MEQQKQRQEQERQQAARDKQVGLLVHVCCFSICRDSAAPQHVQDSCAGATIVPSVHCTCILLSCSARWEQLVCRYPGACCVSFLPTAR